MNHDKERSPKGLGYLAIQSNINNMLTIGQVLSFFHTITFFKHQIHVK